MAACHSPNPPVILLPRGSFVFSPAEQNRLAEMHSVGGIKTGRRRVRGVGCWGGRQWRRRPCAHDSVRGKIDEAAVLESSSTASHNGETVAWFCRACAQQRSERRWSSQGVAASHGSNCQILPTLGSSITPPQKQPPHWLTHRRRSGRCWGQANIWLHMGELFYFQGGGWGSAQVVFWGGQGLGCKPLKPLSSRGAAGA